MLVNPQARSKSEASIDFSAIYQSSARLFHSSQSELNQNFASNQHVIEKILDTRLLSSHGMPLENIATLLGVLRNPALMPYRNLVIDAATALRKRTYGNRVATMVPIELGSYCASNCTFCGWRRDNTAMIRLRVSRAGLEEQLVALSSLGISHFELSGGDDLVFLKEQLFETVQFLKSLITKHSPNARLSICLTPLTSAHYERLRDLGLETVLTWQETYDRNLFYKLINAGPKAHGIDENFNLVRGGDGFLSRATSHERAVRANLQVGIGVMLGLAEIPEADILSVVAHGKHLLAIHGDSSLPLIIGMPIWNAITTTESDRRDQWLRPFSVEEVFEVIGAIYLLSFPDFKAWVFPNCRVSIETQVKSVVSSGVFTSTTVRVGPGAYLVDSNKTEDYREFFQKSSVKADEITSATILNGEQFKHHFHTHEDYQKAISQSGMTITSDTDLLNVACGRR